MLTAIARSQDWLHTYDSSGNEVVRALTNVVAPQIIRQPQPQVVAPGELASFSVVMADSRALTYQWRFNGTNMPGGTSDALLLTNVQTTNEGQYSVVVSNSVTTSSVTSVPAMLWIDSDRDGLPDSWELTYFGNLTSQRGGGDADGDGVSNLQEFLDGTNPTNNASFYAHLTVLGDGGFVTVVPDKPAYDLTDVVTLTGTPFPPNAFSSWTGDLVTRSNPATLTMNSNKTVRAHFLCAPPPAGMVAWWRGENDALDALGANPGTLSNGVSFATGQVGQAFLFNSTNQEVKVPASSMLNVGAGSGLTIEAWIKPSDLVTQFPLVEWNDGTNAGAHMWLNVAFSGLGGPGCFYANLRDVNSAEHYFFTPVNLLSTNVWQHLALTYDRASGVARLFMNGFAVSTVNLGSFVPRTTADLYLGYRPGYLSYSGLLDEPAIYNRALTPSEVLGIYQAAAAGKCSSVPYFTSAAQFPDATAGVGYTQQLTSVLGTLPVGFSLSAGSLPSGLTLSSSGQISGVPSTAGSNMFAILATDAAGQSAEQVCALRVLPGGAPVMVPGLVSWWRAENNGLDSVGTNHGVPTNGATFAAGKVGQAFSFDGVSSYVQVGNNPGLNFSNSVSFEAWIFPTGAGSRPTEGGTVISKEFQYEIARFADGTIHWAFANSSPGWNWVSSGFAAPLNQWSHVAVVYDQGVVSTFVNGVLVHSYTGSGAIGVFQQGQNDFRIGGRQGTDQYFQGQIDEVSIYNRALNTVEIALLYNAGAAGKITVGPYISTASALPDALLGQAYSQTISAIRGTTPIAFAVTAGALPAGMTLSSGGLLAGTPTSTGSFSFTIRATDAATHTADQLFTLQVFAPIPPPGGLIGWWRAEHNGLDSIGTNNGVVRNGASFAAGKVGQAFSLDGVSQSIDIADTPDLRPASMTLEAWILLNSIPGPPLHIFAKPLGSGTLDSYGVYYYNGALVAFLCDTNGAGPPLSVAFSPGLGTWHHIAYTFDDGGKQQALYIDGSQVATGVANKSIGYDTQPLLLGRDIENGSPNFFFPGRVDEAAIYNRALGSNEIASLYGAGPGGKTATGPYFSAPPILPNAVASLAYTQSLATMRGTAPVNFAVIGGALPPGLTLSSTGVLSGAPASTGSFSFVVRATDAASLTGDQRFTLQVFPKVSPPAGLVSWWRAENDALDAIGSNDGFLVNAGTFALGKVGQAFALDGVTASIEVEDTPALRPASLSLESWVMFFSSGGVQVIFSKTLGSGTSISYLLWLQNGNLYGAVGDITGTSSPISAPFSPVVGSWYHVAFTFDDATKQQTLYLSGIPVAWGIFNLSIGYDAHPLLLGADIQNGGQNLPLYGRIDEAAIYNRALGAGEIASLYIAGAVGKTTVGPYIATPPVLPDAGLNQPYTQTVASVRGTLPVTYALAGGSLPQGLTFGSSGVLGGVPTNAGTFNFMVRATDAAGLSGDQNFTLRITAPLPPPAGLVSWWRAENNAQDAVGANHGILTNGGTYAAGKAGQAFVLDGLNDYVSVPDTPGLRPASVTLESWALFTATGTRIILGKPVGSGTSDSYQIYLSAGTLGAFVGDAGGAGTVLSVPFSPVLGQWYHFAYTFDDLTRQQVLYVNGVTVASGLGSKSIGYDGQPLLLGCDIENGSRAFFFSGRLDEAAIYNRALNANEIAAIHTAGAAAKTTGGPYFSTSPPLPDVVVGQPYTVTIASTRGTAPISYTLAQGALPPGLALNSSGVLGGIPSVAGDYSFVLRATDAAGLFADQFYTLQVFAPLSIPDGLLAWWRAEGDARDSAGTNDGVLNGINFTVGKVGSAFSLDGVSSYVQVPGASMFNPTGPFSVEVWIKASSQQFSPDRQFLIVDKSHGFADGTGWVMQGNGDGTAGFYFGKGGSSSPANFVGVNTVGNVQDGHWHHLAGVFTGSQIAIYEDGVLQASLSTTDLPVGNSRDVEIGRSWGGGSPLRYFHGLIDEVSYYNRALSADEIAGIHNAGPAGKGTPFIPPPELRITAVESLGNNLRLSFSSLSGKSYEVQSRSSLSSGGWATLPGSAQSGTGGILQFTVSNALALPLQFYRIRQLP